MTPGKVHRIETTVTDGAQRPVRTDTQSFTVHVDNAAQGSHPKAAPPHAGAAPGAVTGATGAATAAAAAAAMAASVHEVGVARKTPQGAGGVGPGMHPGPAETHIAADPQAMARQPAAAPGGPAIPAAQSGSGHDPAHLAQDTRPAPATAPPPAQQTGLAEAIAKLMRLMDDLHQQSLRGQRHSHVSARDAA